MPGERQWLDMEQWPAGLNLDQTTGDCYTVNFVVAAGEIPAAGASFRGARIRTDTPSTNQKGRFCLYSGHGDGVPLLTYGDWGQLSTSLRYTVYEALFVKPVPVVAGNYQLMICPVDGGSNPLEFRGRNVGTAIGRLRTAGGTYDPPMDPLSTNAPSTILPAMQVFALCAPPLPDLVFGGGRA
jgi:hypothetical protein